MFTVTCCPLQRRNALALRNNFGMTTSGTYEKKTSCPVCGKEVAWFLHSPHECEDCKNELPPFSEIYDYAGAKMEYYLGGTVRRWIWRGMPDDSYN